MSQTISETSATTEDAMQARSAKCARIKDLGFTISKHIKMYGECFEIVSDPFNEGDCIAVHAISESHPELHPTIRTLLLPMAILVRQSVHN